MSEGPVAAAFSTRHSSMDRNSDSDLAAAGLRHRRAPRQGIDAIQPSPAKQLDEFVRRLLEHSRHAVRRRILVSFVYSPPSLACAA